MKTTSLETSKKLKEAGFPLGVTEFYWEHLRNRNSDTATLITEEKEKIISMSPDFSIYPAPTAEEVLDRLPKNLRFNDKECYLSIEFEEYDMYSGVGAYYRRHIDNECELGQGTESLLRSLSEMWFFLKEKQLI